jgi:hypothetical protein
MSQTKLVVGPSGQEIVALSAEEQSVYDADQAAWADGQTDREWAELRRERDGLITETDWWVMPDRTATTAQTTYRQALRDLPANTDDPSNPIWPTKPGA